VRQSLVIAIVAGILVCLPANRSGIANAQSGLAVRTGLLTCRAAHGFGYILGSSRTIECVYRTKSGLSETYMGSLSKVGIDIGYLGSSTMIWAVVASGGTSGSGTLSGEYAGGTAGATLGLGAAINLMTGGFRNSIALQPVSVESNSGLYVGAGIVAMSLEPEDHEAW
jgi:hypothetical protein